MSGDQSPKTSDTRMRNIVQNKDLRRTSGTRGLRVPVDLSQSKLPESRGMVTIESEVEFFMAAIKVQDY